MVHVSYRCTHLPTGETELRDGGRYNALGDFLVVLCRWNTFSPDWKYELAKSRDVVERPHSSTYAFVADETCDP
jgi:hypothetical protein